MKQNQRLKKGAKIALAQEEWDFSTCPKGCELDCWLYEYARESPSVIREFRQCVEYPLPNPLKKTEDGRDARFDKDGYWLHRIDIYDCEGNFQDQLYLELAPGFPEKPYLKTKVKPPTAGHAQLADLFPPSIRDADNCGDAKPQFAAHYFANIFIKWETPDKKLLKDFAKWLKNHRPFPARSRRGKSSARTNMSELKALGAYRLLKTMTAPEAMAHTEKFIQGGLYAQAPDWYEARRNAKKILQYWFT